MSIHKVNFTAVASSVIYPVPTFSKISKNYKIDLWENLGGHVHSSPPRGGATGLKRRIFC